MKKVLLALLVVIILVQLAFLGLRIYTYENTLKNGKVFYFRPQPVDPRDLLKGRYVTLNFGLQNAKCNFTSVHHNDYFYIGIHKKGKKTIIGKAYINKPLEQDFLKVEARSNCGGSDNSILFNFIFDRFYMNEDKAKKLDKIYGKFLKKDSVLAKVRVLDGNAVVEDLTIDSKSVKDYIK